MRPIDVAGFERKFSENIDPWDYTNSRFEHFKRNILLRACGHGKHGRALELGCAIGETTRHLAPLCLRLVALDGSPTAIAEAKRRVQSAAHVRFMLAKLPGQMPHGPFDLIVVSEIAYYLSSHELVLLGKRLAAAVAHRGKIVLLHHRRHFHDATQLPILAHVRLRSQLGRIAIPTIEERYPRFDVVSLRKVHQ